MKTKEDWLLNNPHCKQIESCSKSLSKKCICPKEEPKQETLEEAFTVLKKEFPILNKYEIHHLLQVARFGAKWQQERMYSEEDMKEMYSYGYNNFLPEEDAFKQFKNK